MNEEIWRATTGWEGAYQTSNLGRFRSLDRTLVRSNGAPLRLRGQMLTTSTPALRANGKWRYSQVSLPLRPGETQSGVRRGVHVIVCETFHGPRPDGLVARHLNGDVSDNRAANLTWGTHVENEQDKIRHGRRTELLRTHCPYDHALVEPNLVASTLRAGRRNCLACARTRGVARDARKQGREIDRQAVSDRYYIQIMDVAA